MPRTDSTEDKRWYSLHVHWVIGAWWILCALGRKLNVIDWSWNGWRWSPFQKIWFFFSKPIANINVPSTQSYHSVQNLISQQLCLACHSKHRRRIWCATITIGCDCGHELQTEEGAAEHLAVQTTVPLIHVDPDRHCHSKSPWDTMTQIQEPVCLNMLE